MHEYLAILGREPALSAAELFARSQHEAWTIAPCSTTAMFVDGIDDHEDWFHTFGGLIKLGRVVEVIPTKALHDQTTLELLQHRLAHAQRPEFGMSMYGVYDGARTAKELGKSLKKLFKEFGTSSRFVLGEKGILSSVTVDKQGLLDRGAEFLFVQQGSKIVIAQTVVVQEYESFSQRDYGRPGRDAWSGMLPPKLARMMVNISRGKKDGVLLDPFCGSGTVVQEAALLGYENILGSDNSDKAVTETQENIHWLQENQHVAPNTLRVFRHDVRSVGAELSANTVDTIVTEPFLGPPQHGREEPNQLAAIQKELSDLYRKSFSTFLTILKTHGMIVFVLPVFYRGARPRFLMVLDDLLLQGFELVPPLSPELITLFKNNLTYRNTVLYHRPGQRVGREILLFRKK